MRVSTSFLHSQGIKNIIDQQARVIETQQQLSTGKKNLSPSDDPGAASRLLDLRDAANKIDQFDKNINFAIQKLSLEESALDGVQNVLQRVRELTVQVANSGSIGDNGKAAIVEELIQLNEQLFDLANTKEANGNYLFSGLSSQTATVSRTTGGFTFSGDQEEISLQIGHNRQVVSNDSGADVFQLIRNGNGTFITDNATGNTGNGIVSTGSVQNGGTFTKNDYTIRFTSATTFEIDNVTTSTANITGVQTYVDGDAIQFDGIEISISQAPATGDTFSVNASRNQDILSSIQNLINTVQAGTDSPAENAQYSQGIANALNNMDQSLSNVINIRTKVGARLNSIDIQQDANSSRKLQLETVRSQIEDLDYADAISRLTFQTTALQAAQQTFVKIQDLSLFRFI